MTIYPLVKSHQIFTSEPYPDAKNPQRIQRLEEFIKEPDSSKAKILWDALGLTPENIISFQEAVGGEIFGRFHARVLQLANQIYREGRKEEAADILKKITCEKIGDHWYKLSDLAKWSRRDHPDCSYSRTDPVVSSKLFEEFRAFLRSDVLTAMADSQTVRSANEIDTFFSCWQNDADGFFNMDVPDVVTIEEGASAVLPLPIHTNFHFPNGIEMDWKIEKPNPFLKASLSQNPQSNLQLSSQNDLTTHHQRESTLSLDMVPKNAPWLRVQKKILVKIKNENEAPSVTLQTPSHVTEGKEVCVKTDIKDPEGDKVAKKWFVKKWDGTSTPFHLNPKGDACIQTPVTGKFEYPLDVEVLVRDIIDTKEYPMLQSRSTAASTRIFIDPQLALSNGERIVPSPAVVEVMSNPEIKKLTASSHTSDSYLYTFLRLPHPIEEFEIQSPPEFLANEIAVQKQNAALRATAPRQWSPFEKVPSATNVAVSFSPLRRWTPKGRVAFSSTLCVSDENSNLFQMPLKGTFDVDPPEIRVVVGMTGDCKKNDCHYRLHISNVLDKDSQSFIKVFEKIPVKIRLDENTPQGRIVLWSQTHALKMAESKQNELIYDVPIAWPTQYFSSAKGFLQLNLTNRYGEPATLDYPIEVSNGAPSLLHDLRFKLDPHLIPDPWFLMHIEGDSQLLNGSHLLFENLNICPPEEARLFIRDCTRLSNRPPWNYQINADHLAIPLRPTGYHFLLSSAYRAVGGTMTGNIIFQLPRLEGNSGLAWTAKIELPPADMTIPPDPSIEINWEEICKKCKNPHYAPQYVLLALFAAKGLFERQPKSQAKFITEQKVIKPGERFFVDVLLSKGDEKGKIRLRGLTNVLEQTRDQIRVDLKPKEKKRQDRYELKPLSINPLSDEKFRIEFVVPNYLPDGNYMAGLKTLENIYADYLFTYFPNNPKAILMGHKWEKYLPVVIWDSQMVNELKQLSILGDSSILPPSAEIKRLKVGDQP